MKRLLCLLLLALLLTGCGSQMQPVETVPPELSGSLSVQYLTGGALLQCNGKTLLTDCGEGITPQLLEAYGVESLSAIVLTGCDEIRAAGLAAVLEAFPTTVYAPGKVDGTDVIVPEEERSLWLDCTRLTIHSLDGNLALQAVFGEDSFLFLGDMAPEDQKKLEIKTDVIRVHQSVTLAQELLRAAQTVYVMVDGRAEETLAEQYEVFDTDGFGTVTATTEGNGVNVLWMFSGSKEAAS